MRLLIIFYNPVIWRKKNIHYRTLNALFINEQSLFNSAPVLLENDILVSH